MIMAGSLSQLLGMINSLQLIVHLPFFAVAVPANVMTILQVLIPIVMFDIFESDDLMMIADSVFGTELAEGNQDEDSLIPDQFADLGYEDYNPIVNLGTIAYLTAFYFLQVAFLAIVIVPLKTLTKYGR